ncbi:probable 1,4-beta-D-glucan cellobiohydrolase B isoform X3 [Daphnia pulex]|uniref:probable 1,4-beta-D-glucan cellobiohydrolase B isoform X3 n=1 Tax=Daphnia pulex TaxID=6669 RepID=UPI001EDE0ECE|nr:probable 1,4-beta-D-glucan cellobiohydrolase B isoform X3 [Daphnia pulex]
MLHIISLIICLMVAIAVPVTPQGLDFTLYICTSPGNCQPEQTRFLADWNLVCEDQVTCNETVPLEMYEKQLHVTITNGDQVTFAHYQRGGARLFMGSGDQYKMFYPLNREITFDVDMSTVGCGRNAAAGFHAMPADGGHAEFGYAGAIYGTGFCDGQDDPPNCLEMDIIEANSLATMFTAHPCNATAGKCSAYGCGLNSYPLGHKDFYGRGSNYAVDTTKPFTIITRFITTDGMDTGDLKEVQQLYVQNGQMIFTPEVEGGFSTLSDEFCDYHYIPTFPPGYEDYFHGITDGVTPGMKKGVVLIFGLWGDADDTYMGWLDQEPYGPCPVEPNNPNSTVTFSNVRFGPIGSTA